MYYIFCVLFLCVIFHVYIYIYIQYIYIQYIYIQYIYIQYISGHKWSTKHKVLKSLRSKMGIIYRQSWKQCTWTHNARSAHMHELPQNHWGENWVDTSLFSWLQIYIYNYIRIHWYFDWFYYFIAVFSDSYHETLRTAIFI